MRAPATSHGAHTLYKTTLGHDWTESGEVSERTSDTVHKTQEQKFRRHNYETSTRFPQHQRGHSLAGPDRQEPVVKEWAS